MSEDSGEKAGSIGSGIQAHLSDRKGDIRLGDGEKSKDVASDFSRLCLSLKPNECFWVGDDVHIRVYKKGGNIRAVISCKRGLKVSRTHAKKN